MIDIGVNLTSKQFGGDRTAVVARARDAGVTSMVLTGTSLDSSRQALALAREHELYATAGVHPHDAKTWNDDVAAGLRELAADPRVVALGECGLDFDRNYSTPDQQREAFGAQLELARTLKLPLFLHEREAHEALLEMLEPVRDQLGAVVVHCFTGSRPQLTRYLDLDLHIGITGWICDERRGKELFDIVGDVPLERLMIETDAPWLLPRTLRPRPKGGRNEPAFLTEVRDQVARARSEPPAHVADGTTATARAFFGIT